MSTPSFDPVQYKAGQRQLWDTVAPGWKKWWPTQEQAAQLGGEAGPQPGRILDGEPGRLGVRIQAPRGLKVP
jgi:hypothetical protein